MVANSSPNGDGRHGRTSLPPAGGRGVLLLNLGTPDSPDVRSVRRYLTEFLADPEVIRLPKRLRWMNRPLAALIARFRSPASAEAYATIWGDDGSPLKAITEAQTKALGAAMPAGWSVFYAMRYGNPSIRSVLDEITAAGVRDLVVIPMYPQFSGPTTGTALDELYRHLRGRRQLSVSLRSVWYDDAGYVEAQARLIHEFATERGLDPSNCHLLYSTHSMPESYIDAGDPYQEHVLRTVELVTERLGWDAGRSSVAYQSRLGPVRWLAPSTEDTLRELAEKGERNVIVCPVSFTADCLETLEEIGLRYREVFEASGGVMHLAPALNDFGPFIDVLRQLVLRGPRAVGGRGGAAKPLMRPVAAPAAPADGIDGLVVIGASLPPRLGCGEGPALGHLDPTAFRRLKRPQEEVADLLRHLREAYPFEECLLWNTCSRFELYGWLAPNGASSDEVVERVERDVLGLNGDGAPHYVLRGEAACHHLLRTAAGLNSGLPGDAEIMTQLESARRIAAQSGTDGPRTERLMGEVQAFQERLRDGTDWGRFRLEYCPVALRCVGASQGIDFSGARCVVIGGSATARSILAALREQFGVRCGQLTSVYRSRCRGAQVKRLRAAVGDGSRLRVDRYDDPRVLEAIADADVVFFASDARSPILSGEVIRGLRDFSARPLAIFDFNSFGSTSDVDGVPGVTLIDAEALEAEVKRFSVAMLECPAFTIASQQAESATQGFLTELAEGPAANGNGANDAAPAPANGHAAAFKMCPCGQPCERMCPRTVMCDLEEAGERKAS